MSIDHIEEVKKNIDEIEHIEKFNPFHDARGRFSSSRGMASYSANPKTKAGAMAINRSTAAGYGAVMNVHRESKGENIRQNDNWIRSGQKPNPSQLARAQANAPKTLAQARQNAHTNRVKGTMGATETATARHPQAPKKPAPQTQAAQQKPAAQAQQANQQAQTQQNQQNQKTVHVKQKMRSGATMDVDFDQSKVKGALNKEFKGTATGKDLTKTFDATSVKASDTYRGSDRFTNQVADMQGFNSPSKKVSQAEFDQLKQNCGDVFFRTVGSATIDGKHHTAAQLKQCYTNRNDMDMNGGGGRAYGDGIYTASARVTAQARGARNPNSRHEQAARKESQYYGDGHTTLSMTWLSKPNIINQSKAEREFNNLSYNEKKKFGGHLNTYVCAKGYDAMVTNNNMDGYMVIFNRSKLAILDD